MKVQANWLLLDLIMLSAKYHDIGRKTDTYEEHAEASSKIAIEKNCAGKVFDGIKANKIDREKILDWLK